MNSYSYRTPLNGNTNFLKATYSHGRFDKIVLSAREMQKTEDEVIKLLTEIRPRECI